MEIFVRKLCMALTGSGPHYLCSGKSYATRAMTPIELLGQRYIELLQPSRGQREKRRRASQLIGAY